MNADSTFSNMDSLSDAPPSLSSLRDFNRAVCGKLLADADKFVAMHKRYRLMPPAEVTPDLVTTVDRSHRFLLAMIGFLHAQTSKADFPDRALAEEIDGTLWRLQQTWNMGHRTPEQDAEAEKFIAQYFPDEP